MKVLVTGSGSLIGSVVSKFFLNKKRKVYGIDKNKRMIFFGKNTTINFNLQVLAKFSNYIHHAFDNRDD
jgi:nucleoside-diphosphate-sugar epimerase